MKLKRARLVGALAVGVAATAVSVPQASGGGSAVVKKVAAEVPAAFKKKGICRRC